MAVSNDIDSITRPGALSSAVLARVRDAESSERGRSRALTSGWIAAAAAVVIAGVTVAYTVKENRSALNAAAVIAYLLNPMAGEASPDNTSAAIALTGQLKKRSHFATAEEFKASPSFRTLLMAGKAMPLAIHCKDVASLVAIKLVLGFVSERDPYYAEMMTRRFMQQKPEQFRYSAEDCRKTLPDTMAELRTRI